MVDGVQMIPASKLKVGFAWSIEEKHLARTWDSGKMVWGLEKWI